MTSKNIQPAALCRATAASPALTRIAPANAEQVKAFVSLFQRTAPFAAPTGPRDSSAADPGDGGGGSTETASDPAAAAVVAASYRKLDRVQLSLRTLEARAASMRELEELFELSPTRHTGLVEVRTQLRLLKMVWDTAGLVDGLFASWTATLWADIRTDELLDEARCGTRGRCVVRHIAGISLGLAWI